MKNRSVITRSWGIGKEVDFKGAARGHFLGDGTALNLDCGGPYVTLSIC